MKLIKLKIHREYKNGTTRFFYPKEYKSSKIKFGPIYESHDPENEKKVRARGDWEHIIIGVDENYAKRLLKCPDAEEISEETAKKLGNAWWPQHEVVRDSRRVLSVLAKHARGQQLSQQDVNVLTPEHPEPGINMSPSFEELLARAQG